MSAYDTYTFNFKDTLSKGLTFGQVDSVTVGDTTLTKGTDYTVATSTVSDSTLLTVTMLNFKAKQQTNAGKTITVTYTATLNEKAVVGGAGNVNSATIQYSNKPGIEAPVSPNPARFASSLMASPSISTLVTNMMMTLLDLLVLSSHLHLRTAPL